MAPNIDHVYARGRSLSITLFSRLVSCSDDELDPEYVPLGTVTPVRAAHTTRANITKVGPCVIAASQSEEEHILTGTPSGFATHSSKAPVLRKYRV